jgi:hypothetical protein
MAPSAARLTAMNRAGLICRSSALNACEVPRRAAAARDDSDERVITLRLVYDETYSQISHAVAAEKEITGWRRSKEPAGQSG